MNKKIGIIATIVILVLGSIGIVRFFTKEDQKTTLTVSEKRWIENNKNNIIDFAALNNIPIVSDNGNGLFFDFLDSLESDTELEFNKLSYESKNDTQAKYLLEKKTDVKNSDLILYQDNYVLITKENNYYADITEIKDLNVGTLNNDLKTIENYLTGSVNLTYRGYNSNDELLTALNNNEVNAIVLPKLDYLENILTSDDMYIAYNITEYKINYVITLGDNERLNKILTKYFNKWKQEQLETSFNKYLASTYFTYKEISEKNQTEFRSRRYIYGFVANPPYDITVNGSLKGFNRTLVNNFASANVASLDLKTCLMISKMAK